MPRRSRRSAAQRCGAVSRAANRSAIRASCRPRSVNRSARHVDPSSCLNVPALASARDARGHRTADDFDLAPPRRSPGLRQAVARTRRRPRTSSPPASSSISKPPPDGRTPSSMRVELDHPKASSGAPQPPPSWLSSWRGRRAQRANARIIRVEQLRQTAPRLNSNHLRDGSHRGLRRELDHSTSVEPKGTAYDRCAKIIGCQRTRAIADHVASYPAAAK